MPNQFIEVSDGNRFKGSDESIVGSEMVRWQEKGVSFLSIELLD